MFISHFSTTACEITCNYRVVIQNGTIEFACEVVEGDGYLIDIDYSLNGFSESDLLCECIYPYHTAIFFQPMQAKYVLDMINEQV